MPISGRGDRAEVAAGLEDSGSRTPLLRLRAGTVLISAVPLAADGWLEPIDAAWVLRG